MGYPSSHKRRSAGATLKWGIMLGILGLTAPIVNTFVGSLSSFFPDRYITVRSLIPLWSATVP